MQSGVEMLGIRAELADGRTPFDCWRHVARTRIEPVSMRRDMHDSAAVIEWFVATLSELSAAEQMFVAPSGVGRLPWFVYSLPSGLTALARYYFSLSIRSLLVSDGARCLWYHTGEHVHSAKAFDLGSVSAGGTSNAEQASPADQSHDAAFQDLIRRKPFGSCSEIEWHTIAGRLLRSLSLFLDVPLEFVGGRRPDVDHFAPLIRSVGESVPAIGVRLAGMISCVPPSRDAGLRISALLFLFVGGERVAPPRQRFLTYDYVGPEVRPEWLCRGWQTSDFPEEYEPYTYKRYFCGAEAELPGGGQKNRGV